MTKKEAFSLLDNAAQDGGILARVILGTTEEDACRCACSSHGCLPITKLLESVSDPWANAALFFVPRCLRKIRWWLIEYMEKLPAEEATPD